MTVQVSKENKVGVIEDLKQCPLCETDGEMIGVIINRLTYLWSCTSCPAILFEYHNDLNTKDVTEYLDEGYGKNDPFGLLGGLAYEENHDR